MSASFRLVVFVVLLVSVLRWVLGEGLLPLNGPSGVSFRHLVFLVGMFYATPRQQSIMQKASSLEYRFASPHRWTHHGVAAMSTLHEVIPEQTFPDKNAARYGHYWFCAAVPRRCALCFFRLFWSGAITCPITE